MNTANNTPDRPHGDTDPAIPGVLEGILIPAPRPASDRPPRLPAPVSTTRPADLAERAKALRRQGLSRAQIAERLGIHAGDRLTRLLGDEPPPEWTRRPRAKDDLRERARELRAQGMTYDEIVAELGVSKSSVSLWVRDLPKPASRSTPEERAARARAATQARWQAARLEQARLRELARSDIGLLSDRELLLAGVVLYWAEGAKAKPHRPNTSLQFVNSDPDVIRLYLRWLDLMGVEPERRGYRVAIHEEADVPRAEEFWANVIGVPRDALARTTLKRHNPKTNRKNTGDTYNGCLTVRVLGGSSLYRRVEGWWQGIASGVG
ncbi:helix-turn-helix domain-containing protein [Allostreptomyces psammosilenae]|uniref:Transcriptional regulator with XRE-family HTH domain n=1 Tax=Allostreptomyces psammosilenae TaxID=1892865 RepID=A0A853A681_9ACTN|nr:hypothetical protein [Allostreptomyces psammosilenae]NYI05982.1 transcriptional regulator with XRE-family HTH domain [Allostreptomyces psammosilenae]